MRAAQGKSEIQRLPPYLTVQMVRFFYKVDVQQKAKILRKVPAPACVLPSQNACGQLASAPEPQDVLARLCWHAWIYPSLLLNALSKNTHAIHCPLLRRMRHGPWRVITLH